MIACASDDGWLLDDDAYWRQHQTGTVRQMANLYRIDSEFRMDSAIRDAHAMPPRKVRE
jgi:hypothetical protein